jgi:hypothetical protein
MIDWLASGPKDTPGLSDAEGRIKEDDGDSCDSSR